MKNLIFLGMIGSCTKDIAKNTAEALGKKFVDTDEVLARNTGMSLHDLYTLLPVDTFKDLTGRLATQLSESEDYVIAVGDSILKNTSAISVLKKTAFSVYIHQEADSIFNSCTDSHHPLLARGLTRIYDLYNERQQLFSEYSDITISDINNAVQLSISAYNSSNNNSTVNRSSEPALKAFFKYYIENIAQNTDSESFADECAAAVNTILEKYISEVNGSEH